MSTQVHYERYDKRYGKDGLHETLEWEQCEGEVEEFQKNYILPYIVDTEVSEQTYPFDFFQRDIYHREIL